MYFHWDFLDYFGEDDFVSLLLAHVYMSLAKQIEKLPI